MRKPVLTVLALLVCTLLCGGQLWADGLADASAARVVVSGEVHTPGSYVLAADGSIGSVLTQAGGLSDMAADTIYIERTDEAGQPRRYPISRRDPRLQQAHLLHEGDKIDIPHALEYSISGEVQKPGTYRLDLSLTVAQAVAKAKGGTIFANLRRFEIRRKKDDGTVLMQVRGDDLVEPDDVIRVKVSYP